MKNKKFTYFLGFLVLMVWGVILYRVFDTLANDEDDSIYKLTNNKIDKEPYNDYEIVQDTTPLQLNYKDPFLLVTYQEKVDIPVEKITSTDIKKAPIQPINWNFIKYSGFIGNQASKNLVAIISINGKMVMMSEGEVQENVKLIKNLQDSIKVGFNGNTTFIKIR